MMRLILSLGCLALTTAHAQPAEPAPCNTTASLACYVAFQPAPAGGQVHYYTSRHPGTAAADASPPTAAIIALHGHPRDAPKTFNATLLAVRQAGALGSTLVVAPLFQVGSERASRCQAPGVPPAQAQDLLWTCQSWAEGAAALNGSGLTAFATLDALIAELQRQWPSLRTITVAGFSAGAQLVQHYIGFAAKPTAGLALRYVVASPGSWLYFDAARPAAPADAPPCAQANQWKYGTDQLPTGLPRTAEQARAHYARANISYLAGANDSSDRPGAFYNILDKSCPAQAQGPYRLQRATTYATQDHRPLTVVPGCAHDVACVFPAEAARAALLGGGR